MIGIYHKRDLDGFTSGAIIKYKYPDAKMIGYDYGDDLEVSILKDESVIMADVSFPIEKMIEINKLTNNMFVWIDHHISAIREYYNYVINNDNNICVAVLDNKMAACQGTWKHLFPDKEIPKAITLLGKYDIFDKSDIDEWNNVINPFQYGMRRLCNSLDEFPTELFEDNSLIDKIIEDGNIILSYQAKSDELKAKSSFEAKLNNLNAICLNGGGFGSSAFNSVYDEDKHDIMLSFFFNGKEWIVSLYTTKDNVDCSVIAKTFGGGGHKGAAGFQTDDIFKIIDVK